MEAESKIFLNISHFVSIDTTIIFLFDIMGADSKIFPTLLQFITIIFTILYAL